MGTESPSDICTSTLPRRCWVVADGGPLLSTSAAAPLPPTKLSEKDRSSLCALVPWKEGRWKVGGVGKGKGKDKGRGGAKEARGGWGLFCWESLPEASLWVLCQRWTLR